MLASGLVGTDLDYEAIDAFLTLGFVPGPMTPLAARPQAACPDTGWSSIRAGARTEAFWSYPRARAGRDEPRRSRASGCWPVSRSRCGCG